MVYDGVGSSASIRHTDTQGPTSVASASHHRQRSSKGASTFC